MCFTCSFIVFFGGGDKVCQCANPSRQLSSVVESKGRIRHCRVCTVHFVFIVAIKQHTPNLKRCTNLPPVLVFLVQIVVRTSRNSHDCCFQALINFVVSTTTTTEVPPFNSSHWTIKGEKKKGCSALSFFNLRHTERSCKNMRRNWKKTLLSVWALSEDSLEVLYLSISILCYVILPLNDISEVKYCIDSFTVKVTGYSSD